MHHREYHRPSSTGRLIQRILPASRTHVWRRERGLKQGDIRILGRELWILHPRGEPVPDLIAPEKVQLLLLDGSWTETAAMAQEITGWGRPVCLPMTGKSRYWLRQHVHAHHHSTVEALMFVLRTFGLFDAERMLRVQFELHVYASLRARGHKELAMEYLKESPAREAFPELLAQLDVRRPLEPS